MDLEYTVKLMGDSQYPQRYKQHVPSGDLRHMAVETEIKAHNDKPFFTTAVRLLHIPQSEVEEIPLNAMTTFMSLFQHGGRPLNVVTEMEYKSRLSLEQIKQMFVTGMTYRPGFLLNSRELAGLAHFPSADVLIAREIPIETLEPLTPKTDDLSEGTKIGKRRYTGQELPVHIPPTIRACHTHIIGSSGYGKSTLLEGMSLDDIAHGKGIAVLDPHGDLVERLLCLIPESCVERVIYFNPGDPDWVPLWNPLSTLPGQDSARTSDDLLNAFKKVVTGWGDRLEHLLRNSFYALLELTGKTLFDVSNLLQSNSAQSQKLRHQILQVVENETARQFWLNDFDQYRRDDFSPPKHKLGKLLLAGTVSLMLSQPENRFHLRSVMDEGMIFLANLSTIGSEIREILGCFILSLFHITALSRGDLPQEDRRPFHIYCDEAHRFMTESIEDFIAETRKFRVSLTLAHQFLSQFGTKKMDALANAGSSIFFNMDSKEAQFFARSLHGRVTPDQLHSLDVGCAIARIGKEIVRVETPINKPIPERHFREENYCSLTAQVLQARQ